MVLTICAERRNSPFSGRPSTSSCTVCSRSPCATAAIARVTSVVGQSRSSISELTDDSISPQAPSDRPKRTRWRVLPSRPTTWPTRSSCRAMRWLAATISLKVSATFPMRPTWWPGIRTEKSPTRTACSACRSSRSSGFSPPLAPGAWARDAAAAVAAVPFLILAATSEARGIKFSGTRKAAPSDERSGCGTRMRIGEWRDASPGSVGADIFTFRPSASRTWISPSPDSS